MRGFTVAYGAALILVYLGQHPPKWAEVIHISGDRSVGFLGHTLSVSIAPAARESNDLGLLRGGEPFPSCEWKPTTLRAEPGRQLSVSNLQLHTGTLTVGAGGLITINGSLTQAAGGVVNVDVRGRTNTTFGRIIVTGVHGPKEVHMVMLG